MTIPPTANCQLRSVAGRIPFAMNAAMPERIEMMLVPGQQKMSPVAKERTASRDGIPEPVITTA